MEYEKPHWSKKMGSAAYFCPCGKEVSTSVAWYLDCKQHHWECLPLEYREYVHRLVRLQTTAQAR
jgi:hypothetical protein